MSLKDLNNNESFEELKRKQELPSGRKLLVNKDFQFKFIGIWTLVLLSCLASFYLISYTSFEKLILEVEQLELPSGHPLLLMLRDHLRLMSKAFIVFSFIAGAFVMTVALYFSNRIAGPFYRLNRVLRSAVKDDKSIENINFREDDFFQEIPEAINLYAQKSEVRKFKKVS